MFFWLLIKVQAIAKDINPATTKKTSLGLKFKLLSKKIKNIETTEKRNKGINFEVIKTINDLYFFELNKTFMPT